MPVDRSALLLIAFALVGCASPALFAEETVGQRFRKALAEIDANCRQLKIGPFLDQNDPEYRRKVAVTSCDILKLEPRNWREAKMAKLDSQAYPVPEHWLATPEGRFAHSIKLPPSVELLAEDLNSGDGEKIFQRLCDRYAGEFVLRKVTGVDGLLQARPFQPYPAGYRGLVFWTHEKGELSATPQDGFVQPPMGEYSFFEMWRRDKRSDLTKLVKFERGPVSASTRTISAQIGDGKFATFPYVVVEREISEPSARFAYTWRGTWPGQGVEHGIEGFELIVYQVEPFQVMAVRRDFVRHNLDQGQSDARMTVANSCSMKKAMSWPGEFIRSVISPKSR